METLFAPWRLSYLMSEKTKSCIFCAALRDPDDSNGLIVHRGDRVFSMLNRYPYANGHVMVAPVAHHARLSESDGETLADLIEEISRTQSVLLEIYRPSGFNVGANFGKAAGAGIEDHYHFHVVPRWDGDTNFMSVTSHTRVIPEELSQTRRTVAEGFKVLRDEGAP
jgi:ATP adenylyltransferase